MVAGVEQVKKAKKLLPWDQKLFDSQPGRSLKCALQHKYCKSIYSCTCWQCALCVVAILKNKWGVWSGLTCSMYGLSSLVLDLHVLELSTLTGFCSSRMKDARNIPREGGFGGGGAYQKLKKGVPSAAGTRPLPNIDPLVYVGGAETLRL